MNSQDINYIVLARKYRPQTFDELIGQSHISQLLKKSIEANRIAHAFLFCGPRGVGKTSCARILAKALNCERGPCAKPCGECYACQEIVKGTNMDTIEIDGASNRGIDEIRTLRENVKFVPGFSRFKVYIVDEVHMLTTEAFNALLKTLEEPPIHVKFILATTAPHKVPSTIISRCQRFDFKRISIKGIIKVLEDIAIKERLKIDSEASYAIAKSAQGSLRDALSIFDQLSAINQKKIIADDVFALLGVVELEMMFEITEAIAQKNAAKALKTLDEIIQRGKDLKQFNKDLIEHFRHMLIIKIGGNDLSSLVDYPSSIKQNLYGQAKAFSVFAILNMIDVLIKAQEMSRVVGSNKIPLEITLARLAAKEGDDLAIPFDEQGSPSRMNVLSNRKGHIDIGSVEKQRDKPENDSEEALPLTIADIRKSWDFITHAISKEKMSVATFLQEGAPMSYQQRCLVISFPQEASFHMETIQQKNNRSLIEKVISDMLHEKIRIEMKISADHQPQDESEELKSALKTFKGKVVSKWHREI